MEHFLTIPRAQDATILDALSEISGKYENANPSFMLLGQNVSVNPSSTQYGDITDTLRRKNSCVIVYADISIHKPNITISYQRGGPDRSGIFDQIRILSPDTPEENSTKARLDIVSSLLDSFKVVDPNRHFGGPAAEAQAQLEALHNAILQRLEQAATAQIHANASHVRELESDYAEKRKRLDTEAAQKNSELEERERELKRELDVEREDLRKRHAALDDRQNTHARRSLQDDIKKKIADRQREFHLTKGTRWLRAPIHAVCVTLLLGSGALLAYTSGQAWELIRAWQSGGNHFEIFYAIAKNAVVAAAFVSIALFYLRWMNRWFEQHADAEFLIKKMELDIDRASWVVEAALEWQNQVKRPMPEALLGGISRNLFDNTEKYREDLRTPADELASALFGSAAAKAKINNGGLAELEITPSKLPKSFTHT